MKKPKMPYPDIYRSDILGKWSFVIIGFVVLFILLFIFFFSKFSYYWRERSSIALAGIFAILFGIFSIGSYIVARRVERLIREKFSDYEEFLRRAAELIKKPSGSEVLVMLLFPAFGLTNNVKNLKDSAGEEIHFNDALRNLLEDAARGVKVTILQEDMAHQLSFINKMKETFPEIRTERINEQLAYINATIDICTQKAHCIRDSQNPFPFHMFISGDHAIYTALPESWAIYAKTKRLPCRGYETHDESIIASLRKMFKFFEDMSKPVAPRKLPS